MTATNHVLTGAIIAAAVHNPVVALPLALASHFALDALPHFGIDEHISKKFFTILSLDMVCAFTLLMAIVRWQPSYWPLFIACGVLAASPDLMWLPHLIAEMKHKKKKMGAIARFHARIQWGEQPWGWPIELIWFAAGLPLLIHLAS